MNIKLGRFFELVLRETPEGASAAADGADAAGSDAALPDPVDPTQTEPDAPAPAPPSPQMVPVDVMQRRVSALTRQKADLERELELLRLGQTLDPTAQQQPTPQPRPNLVNEAQLLAEQMRREEKAQAVATAGLALSPDFMLRINNMNQMLGQLPNAFLDAVMDAGETDEGAAQLLYDLSQDLQKAGTIINLTPTKMAVALTKIQQTGKAKPAKPAAPKAPTNPPPAPIGPKATGGKSAPVAGDLADPNLSMSDWIAQRDKAAASSRRY